MRVFFTVFSFAALVASLHAAEPVERYRSIIDRQMFGKPPPGFDPMKMPSEVTKAEQKALTKEQEKLQSSVHFSVINIADDGTPAVGFTDNADPKNPVHFYLRVGETQDGWTVKTADPKAATMTIVKGDIELSMTLGENSAPAKGERKQTNASASPATPEEPKSRLLGMQSLRGRRSLRLRREQEAAAKLAAENAAREEEENARREQEKAERDAAQAAMREEIRALREDLKRKKEASAAGDGGQSGQDGNENDDSQ